MCWYASDVCYDNYVNLMGQRACVYNHPQLPQFLGNLVNLQILRCERNKLMILPQRIGG